MTARINDGVIAMIEVSVLISGIAVICSVVMLIVTLKRNNHTDSKVQATEMTTVIVKLEAINSNVSEIRSDMKALKTDVQDLRDRVIIVEQSTKSAHKRLDTIVKGRDVVD